MMNKKELLLLEKYSRLSPEELKTESPELFSLLEGKANSRLKESLSARFRDSSEELRQHIEQLELRIEKGKEVDIKALLVESLKSKGVSEEVRQEAAEKIKELEPSAKLEDVLRPDVPLENNPLFQLELQQAKLYRLGNVVELNGPKVGALLNKGISLVTLNDTMLESLVNDEELEDGEAKALGLAASLYHLLDEDIDLAETIKKGSFPQIPGEKVGQIKDLVAFEKKDWLAVLEETDVTPPNGLQPEDYAALLTKKIENLYPSDVLMARIIPKEIREHSEGIEWLQPLFEKIEAVLEMVHIIPKQTGELSKGIERLQSLFEKNKIVFGVAGFDSLNTAGIEADEAEELRKEHLTLKYFANTYPGLRLNEILDNRELSIATKTKHIQKRIGLLKKFQEQNSEVEFLAFDYVPESPDLEALNFEGVSLDEQRMVLSTVKAYQRTYSITKDIEHTQRLMATGYHSAFSIANDGLESFRKNTGLSSPEADSYYRKAMSAVVATSTAIGSVVDLEFGGFGDLAVANEGPSIENYLKKFDGFEALFGSQDYCKCEHCQSILSPAAYFVDLMYFVEKNILSYHFTGDKEDHVLNLKVRRPDLWNMVELTCENTHQQMPYLEIINEILENYIATRTCREFVDNPALLRDRSAVENVVYQQLLQNYEDSFQQPFLLPLEELDIYLSHFDKTRGEIASLLEESQAVISRTTLKLSKREYELITRPDLNIAVLNCLYDIGFNILASSGKVDPFDAQLLLKPMGLTRAELSDLVETAFVITGGFELTEGIFIRIKGEKTNEDSVQNDIERIYGLTTTSLDRMHRFTRLWRQVPWSIWELDLVLFHLAKAGLANGIEENTLYYLVVILSIQKRFNVSVEELGGLWSNLPRHSVSKDKKALFDRLFNLRDFVLLDGEFPKDTIKFIHPAFREISSAVPVDNALPRLLAGLRISDEELYLLITNLSVPLHLNLSPTSSEADKGFNLTVANLSLLYRHARLAKWLRLTVPELFQLIAFAPSLPANSIENLSQLSALLKFYDWWRTTDYSLDDLGFITGGQVKNIEAFPDQNVLADQLLDEVKTESALTFTDTVFAFLEGVTEEQSRAIVFTNAAGIEATPDGITYWLSENFDSTASALTFTDTLFAFLEGVSDDQSRAIIAANAAAITPDGTAYTLSNTFAPDAPLIIPPDIPATEADAKSLEGDAKSLLLAYFAVAKADIRSVLLPYHATEVIPSYLSGKLKVSARKTKELIKMVGADLTDPDFTLALQGSGAPDKLVELIDKLLPLSILFKDEAFDADSLNFTRSNPDLFGINDFTAIDIQSVQKLALYRGFLRNTGEEENEIPGKVGKLEFENGILAGITEPSDKTFIESVYSFAQNSHYILHDEIPEADRKRLLRILSFLGYGKKLQSVLLDFDSASKKFSPAHQDTLAQILDAEPGLTRTLHKETSLPGTPLEALDKLRRCVELAKYPKYLGVSGEVFKLMVSDDYNELAQASSAVLSAFRAKYDDEEEWQEKIEPFENKIHSRKRDALVDFLIHSIHPEFESPNDLYHHFLIDVELEGCARTSRVVAAISSVQLYVHRVLMNLEQDRAGEVYVTLKEEALDEWDWRKNYRVWEANRKVFLYPENYIEPELRDNKTPLFEELESTLLQQEINEQTVLDAYASYMRGFEEVAHLKIAGSYHDKDRISRADVLHLFGVTAGDPPTYYYRTVENAHYGETEDDRGIVWNPWRKIDVQIPVRKVAPIVFRGQLYVFWVEIVTRPLNEVKDNASEFIGYQHKMSLKFTMLRLDGTWTAPQQVSLYGVDPFQNGDGIIKDPLWEEELGEYDRELEGIQEAKTPRYDTQVHYEPMDGYTLTGFQWDQVYPERLVFYDKEEIKNGLLTASGKPNYGLFVVGRNFELSSEIDFYRRKIKGTRIPIIRELDGVNYQRTDMRKILHVATSDDRRVLFRGSLTSFWFYDYANCSVILEDSRTKKVLERHTDFSEYDFTRYLKAQPLATINYDDELAVINGSLNDCIIDSKGDLLLLQGSVKPASYNRFLLKRLGTTLSETVAETLFAGGVQALLDMENQKILEEASLPIDLSDRYIEDASNVGKLDFTGSYGIYYREIFFHIPFLIANHLNSQQKFAEAQKWYHYMFNPTANEIIDVSDPALSPEDRNWRYIEFREHTIKTLRDQLMDSVAIETYKKDPFNPHAIARLRLSAYQKCIVMKYIDNLLDWGDHLFAQDTMESINEATLFYIMAADILGDRPAELGECGEGEIDPKTYENIKPLLTEESESEFLIEMEHFVYNQKLIAMDKAKANYHYTMEPLLLRSAISYPIAIPDATMDLKEKIPRTGIFKGNDWKRTRTAYWIGSGNTGIQSDSQGPLDVKDAELTTRVSSHALSYVGNKYIPSFGLSFVRQISPVFCIPNNKDLRRYWDRVEDRLYKIRHCMNISGVRRELSLFAPEIDPGLLVRARAAGLSIEDVLNAISGNLPPYRFTYLIEKAKNYASVIQGFGTALLSALEKKDVEELNRLRTLHQTNILKLTTQVRKSEIDAVDESIKALDAQKATVQYRKDYYQGLISDSLTPWERAQQVAQHTASIGYILADILSGTAGVLHLLPQLGSPFALKYGGVELGSSSKEWANVARDTARVAERVAASAGLEAGFGRRKEGWEHQKELANHELDQIEKQWEAAKIRKEIAEKSLEIHKKDIEQVEEVYAFYGDKFSKLGLYTWLSTTLQRLYREAYNCAYSMAKLAEQAYRFERSDDSGELLSSNYWEASRTGLLAGERLLIDLQNLERKFIETNYRSLEIDQAFSLTQIDPAALLRLKETGTCELTIPEMVFDVFYPGQYKRIIKAVRLTIPCVTGPYTNISCKLTLTNSKIRKEPKMGPDFLHDVPEQRSTSVATSNANNDAGVFELNFRDERYMPFEGAGAISTWRLELPTVFRLFDYDTISDVIFHISYTAKDDGLFKESVQTAMKQSLIDHASTYGLFRLFSMKQEFPGEFYRLLHPAGDEQTTMLNILPQHFPYILREQVLERKIQLTSATVFLQPKEGKTIDTSGLTLSIKGVNAGSWTASHGDLQEAPVSLTGDPIGVWEINAGVDGLDKEVVKDIFLLLNYTIQ